MRRSTRVEEVGEKRDGREVSEFRRIADFCSSLRRVLTACSLFVRGSRLAQF